MREQQRKGRTWLPQVYLLTFESVAARDALPAASEHRSRHLCKLRSSGCLRVDTSRKLWVNAG